MRRGFTMMFWFMIAVYAVGIATYVTGRQEIFIGFGVLWFGGIAAYLIRIGVRGRRAKKLSKDPKRD